MEQLPKHSRILRRSLGPHVPQVITQRISHKFIMLIFLRIVLRWRWLGVRVVTRVQFLRGQETKVLAPQVAAKGGSMAARFVGLAVHCALEDFLIFHYDSDFAVVVPDLRAVVDVGAATDGDTVVDDEEFSVDVEFLLNPKVGLFLLVAFPCLGREAGLAEHCIFGDTNFVSRQISTTVLGG